MTEQHDPTHGHEDGHEHDEHAAAKHGHAHGGHHDAPELPPLEDAKQPTREQYSALRELVQSQASKLEGRNRAFVLHAIAGILKDKSVKEKIGMLISKVQQNILTELEHRETRKSRMAQTHGHGGTSHGRGTSGSHGSGHGH